jgi:hypothetical protein
LLRLLHHAKTLTMKVFTVPEMKPLSFLVGEWKTEGEIHDETSAVKQRVSGQDSYEWVSGGFFLLHRVDVNMGKDRVEVIELIGSSGPEKDDRFTMHSFDNQGKVAVMKGHLEQPNLFKIEGQGLRSTLKVAEEGKVMLITWEQFSQGTWNLWITMTLTRKK